MGVNLSQEEIDYISEESGIEPDVTKMLDPYFKLILKPQHQ